MAARPERVSPPWAKTWDDLKSLSDDELRQQHDDLLTDEGGRAVGVDYYLSQLAHRDVARRERRMEFLTGAILVLTIVNVAVVIIASA